MKKLNFLMLLLSVLSITCVQAQTNPAPFDLSSGDFAFTGFTDPESTTYPNHTQGWSFSMEPDVFTLEPASNDRLLVGNSVSATAGNIRNEGAEGISFLNSSSNHIGALAVALNTTGRENLTVSWEAEDIRDGDTRQNGLILQYRVGDEGNFSNVSGTTYLSDPTGLAALTVFSEIELPEAVNDQPLVQLRWLYFYESGGGARDRIRLNNILVESEGDVNGGEDVLITFQVDMSEFTGTIQPEGMHIAGNFDESPWTPGARAMSDEGNGIWSWTEALSPGSELEYKYVLGPDWVFGDENMGGQSCAAPGTTNRLLVVPQQSGSLDPVCYESCNPCGAAVETSMVTFQVDMSQQVIAPEGVGLSGSFNGFEFEAMEDQGDGIYSLQVELEQGITVEYKFRNGPEFENPPAECGTGGFNNRELLVPDMDAELEVVCYGECAPCIDTGEDFELTMQVDASEISINPQGLYIAGSFNDFLPEAMNEDGDGLFSFVAEVEAGSTVEWIYLNGSDFNDQEDVPAECGVEDEVLGFRRFFEMPAENVNLDPVCFSSCEACEGEPVEDVFITFQVDASNLPSIDPAGIHIAGTFNGFSPEPMNDAGNNIFTFTAQLPAQSTVLWKYTNSPDFSQVEDVPAECGDDDGFGGFNRIYQTSDENEILDVVCFSSCEACTEPGTNYTLVLQVDASEIDISPEGIFIAGNFNGFTPEAMTAQGDGLYSISLQQEEGSLVLWKYLNGSGFDGQEDVPGECGEPDGFGGFNRDFVMPSADFTFDPVCFSSCSVCEGQPVDNVMVTFQVDGSALVGIDPMGIHIAGSFNGFNPEPMENMGGGQYSITVELEVGSTALYKFINGDDFENEEEVPEQCGEPDGFGGFNRVFNVPAVDQVIDLVCFDSCDPCVINVFNVGEKENFKLFPNPNNGDFSIVAPATGAVDLRIFDLSGRLVHANRFNSAEGEVQAYSRALLDPGYYLVELRYADKTYSARMLVTR